MSKTIGANLQSHIAEEVLTTAILAKLTRQDGTIYGFTDHDKNITYSGVTYEAASGIFPSAIFTSGNLSVDNLQAQAFLESARITEADLTAGLYDQAELDIYLINYKSVADGIMYYAGGWILGEVTIGENQFSVEINSKSQKLQQNIIELTSPDCRADLGDIRCKIPVDPDVWDDSHVYAVGDFVKASVYDERHYECTTAGTSDIAEPAWDTTIGNTTNDNTVIWTTRLAWTLQGTVTQVGANVKREFMDLSKTEADDYYNYGKVTWLTGDNTGYSMEVKTFAATEFMLFLNMPNNIDIGDTYEVIVGCDKMLSTCKTKFDNILNFRGEPFLPGMDEIIKVGATQST